MGLLSWTGPSLGALAVAVLLLPCPSRGFLQVPAAIQRRAGASAPGHRAAAGAFASWKGASSSVRVSTYNVLSSQLCEPEYYTACDPEALDADNRLERLMGKLRAECAKGSVICLQEVSREWSGPLHQFFSSRGYSMMYAGYGTKKNGYMGVALAFSTDQYELQDAVLERVSDLKKWPRAPPPSISSQIKSWFNDQMRKLRKSRKQVNEWSDAEKRHNCHIFARLQSRKSGSTVCVATYHMPCQFRIPSVMVIHTALAAQRLQSLAGSDPLIWCGDFNFKPGDAPYKLLTEGTLDETDPDYPRLREYDAWKPEIAKGMYSAYAQLEGQEPAYTNWAQVRESAPFVGCLDYIFMSSGCKATSVLPLPKALPDDDPDAVGPFPTQQEPSDHVLIAAEVQLP